MSIGQQTGGDGNSRVNEARELIRIIEPSIEQLSPKERSFVENMTDDLEHDRVPSGRQLFWLRDIKDGIL